MVKAYLTIDDSPSADFMGKVEFLAAKKIPAIFFCRGDLLEKRSDEVIKAIQMGFVAGSHSYLHKRHSTLSITEASAAIRKNDELLDNIYAKAGVQRKWKLFRFPYLDNGAGSFPCAPENLTAEEKSWLTKIMSDVVGSCVMPTAAQLAQKSALQEVLEELGYQGLPDITSSAYQKGFGKFDINITYCTDDWHLLTRHQATYHQTADDLITKVKRELLLAETSSPQVILAHDYGEKEPDESFRLLVSFMQESGVDFLSLP